MSSVRKGSSKTKIVSAPWQSAEASIGTLEQGCRIFGLNKGQYSLVDILIHVLRQTGPAHVTCCVWTTGIADVRLVRDMLDDGRMTGFSLITDRSFALRQPQYEATVRELLHDANIRTTETHAKFLLIKNAEWSIVVRGSMNLNRNPRFEQFDLDDDAGLLAFLEGHVAELTASMPPGLRPTARQIQAGLKSALGGGMGTTYDAPGGPGDGTTLEMTKFREAPAPLALPAVGKPLTLPGLT